jgi:hypothetical protein
VLRGTATRVLTHGASRVPGLRRLPVLKLLAVAEIAILARNHVTRLDPDERHRLVELVRKGRGRATRLTEDERDELHRLVAKTEPRLFVGLSADKLSPVPLPRRLIEGKRRRT